MSCVRFANLAAVNVESDPGQPIAYEALSPGTPVFDNGGAEVGKVKEVLADEQEDVFDGIVIETGEGTRFIDASEVGAIAEHRVDLKLAADAIRAQPEHEVAAPMYEARDETSGWQDLWRRITLRRLWRRK